MHSPRVPFEYAIVRVVPRVEREEFVNAGAIVFCEAHDFLAARIELDVERLRAVDETVDLELVKSHLDAIPRIAAGGPDAGAIGALPVRERFRWLVAPRSTILQTSAAHAGLCETPAASLEHILATIVRTPRG